MLFAIGIFASLGPGLFPIGVVPVVGPVTLLHNDIIAISPPMFRVRDSVRSNLSVVGPIEGRAIPSGTCLGSSCRHDVYVTDEKRQKMGSLRYRSGGRDGYPWCVVQQ